MKRVISLVLMVALGASACGGQTKVDDTGANDGEGVITATCPIGVPDCNDADLGNGGESPAYEPNSIAEGEPNGSNPDGTTEEGTNPVPDTE